MSSIKIDTNGLTQALALIQKKLPYSAVTGVNNTAKAFQAGERNKLSSEFTLRSGKTTFMQRQIAYIPKFATKADANPEVTVQLTNGQQNNLLLSMYEGGGDRPAFYGAKIAVPVIGADARPTFAQSVPGKFTFQRLQFQNSPTKGGSMRIIGKQRTYVVPGVGVFERIGGAGGLSKSLQKKVKAGKLSPLATSTTQLIYSFRTHEQIKPRLTWLQTAQETGHTQLSANVLQQFLADIDNILR